MSRPYWLHTFDHRGERGSFLKILPPGVYIPEDVQRYADAFDLDTVPEWFKFKLKGLAEPEMQKALDVEGGILNTIDFSIEYAEVVEHVAWVLWVVATTNQWHMDPTGTRSRDALLVAFKQVLRAVRSYATFLRTRPARRGCDILALWDRVPEHARRRLSQMPPRLWLGRGG